MTTRGLVIGKFLPPHRGHHHLIDRAQAGCDDLVVIVFGRSDEPIDLEQRVVWLRRRHPGVTVVGELDDAPVDFRSEAAWRHWTAATQQVWARTSVGGGADGPDVVFSSEDYGAELARRLGARHEPVDVDRREHHVSGSLVRSDPIAAWEHLDPAVRAFFVKRIAVVGAESTGKTTLCEHLADHYGTAWVPEYGRTYSEERGLDGTWTSEEFDRIAARQLADEDAAAERADRVLICDTDALATGIWHERYRDGERRPAVEAMVRPYALHLLAMPDVPWVDDGLRDGEHTREWMTRRFIERLDEVGARVVRLTGSWSQREAAAITAIDEVLREPWAGAGYVPDEPGMVRRV